MFELKVKDKTYEVVYGYRSIAVDNVLDLAKRLGNNANNIEDGSISEFAHGLEEILLYGLKKENPDFKYSTPKEKEEKLEFVRDLLDDYTKEKGNIMAFMEIFTSIMEDLFYEGFSSKTEEME